MLTDTIWKNARLATMKGATGAGDIGAVDNGVIAAKDGRIVYAGPAADAPALDAREIVDCAGRWITPGLIDCHTHLIHGGDRAAEFEMRLEGASYEEIARSGGGIVSTMRATRAASEGDLVASALPRLDALIAEGATTVEVKSGYGLDGTSEIRMLRAARAGHGARGLDPHDISGRPCPAPEFAGNADGYIALLCDEVLPRVAQQGLADAVDAFCEGIAFSPEQTARMFEAAARHGLPVKLHADQLSNLHGAALAARHGALSADHLEHCDAAGIAAMARAGTVATLLPGPITSCAKPGCPRSPPCARQACPSRWRPTAIRAHRR
jgi:imidazolonepropionase